MANISTSVDETFIVWWTDFMIILCFLQIWEIEVVMLFLTLASNMIKHNVGTFGWILSIYSQDCWDRQSLL